MTKIKYAGRAEYAAVFVEEPAPREHAARIRWAVRHALEDARRYGDRVFELVSINDRHISADDRRTCAQIIREEAPTC